MRKETKTKKEEEGRRAVGSQPMQAGLKWVTAQVAGPINTSLHGSPRTLARPMLPVVCRAKDRRPNAGVEGGERGAGEGGKDGRGQVWTSREGKSAEKHDEGVGSDGGSLQGPLAQGGEGEMGEPWKGAVSSAGRSNMAIRPSKTPTSQTTSHGTQRPRACSRDGEGRAAQKYPRQPTLGLATA